MKTNRIIYCIFLKKHTIGLPTPCYPGELGKYIYNNISKEAWILWQNKQTILINENRLNMLKPEDRLILEKEMKNFLFNTV